MLRQFSVGICVLALALASCGQVESADENAESIATGDAIETADTFGPIPGPRTCFWMRGPHSADPYINLAYPDANVFYWASTFTVPDDAELRIEGEYPYSRYMSLISYDERGRPVESLADYLIAPGAAPDGPSSADLAPERKPVRFAWNVAHAQDVDDNGRSINPFIPGNRRDSKNRDYFVKVVSAAPENERAIGERTESSSGNILHVPRYGAGNQQMVLYRIYLPDDRKAPDGGVSLPEPVLVYPDGTELRGQDACDKLNSSQPLAISLDAVGVPPSEYRKLINQPDKPDTWPSKIPAEWFIQLDRESLLGIYTGYTNPDARRSEGGFYPNLDNHYIRTIINRKHGKVFMLRGKAPSTPTTHKGDMVMGDGELRYWSICSNQGLSNTRVNDCLFDEEIPLDARGYYTVVISREEDRPRNAVPECGIGWLPMAEDGDGLFDPDVTVVQIRHMLTAPDFDHSVQRVFRQENLEKVMGQYLPVSRYGLPNQIETFFPCMPRSKSAD
ncbi:MAG: hypothetical protein ACE37M_11405 [Henriciella sp.]